MNLLFNSAQYHYLYLFHYFYYYLIYFCFVL